MDVCQHFAGLKTGKRHPFYISSIQKGRKGRLAVWGWILSKSFQTPPGQNVGKRTPPPICGDFEPIFGTLVVLMFGLLGVFVAMASEASPSPHMHFVSKVATMIMCILFVVALSCLYVLLFRSDELQRSANTCYPIPGIIADQLNRGEHLNLKSNIPGPAHSLTLGSWCVRHLEPQ